MKWNEVIQHPSVWVILGFRRRGKTALSYFLTEMCANEWSLKKVVFGLPEIAKDLLPNDYHFVSNPLEFPKNSVIIIDEISLFAHARRSGQKSNLLFDRIVANSGKMKQIIFYVSHHSRKIDVNLIADIDGLIYKKPSLLQLELDRPAVRKFGKRAYSYLKDKDKSYSYIYNFMKDIEGKIVNPLPDFWSDELSNLVSIQQTETPSKGKPEEEYVNDAGGFDESSIEELNKDELFEMMMKLPKNSLKRSIIFKRYMDIHIRKQHDEGLL